MSGQPVRIPMSFAELKLMLAKRDLEDAQKKVDEARTEVRYWEDQLQRTAG